MRLYNQQGHRALARSYGKRERARLLVEGQEDLRDGLPLGTLLPAASPFSGAEEVDVVLGADWTARALTPRGHTAGIQTSERPPICRGDAGSVRAIRSDGRTCRMLCRARRTLDPSND